LQDYNCNFTTALSILVIENFSVTTTCALYYFDLQPMHFSGHDCRNSGHKIAELQLLTERQWS